MSHKLWLCESKELGFHLKGDIIKETNFIMYQSIFLLLLTITD